MTQSTPPSAHGHSPAPLQPQPPAYPGPGYPPPQQPPAVGGFPATGPGQAPGSFPPPGTGAGTGAVRPAGFGGALASEWTKLWSVRSTVWSLALLIALMLGLDCTLPLLEAGQTGVPTSDSVQMLFPGSLLGMVTVVPLGALTITAEYRTGMIRTTFVTAPRRLRVFAAKLLVLTAVLLTASLGCATAGMLVAHLELPGNTVGELPLTTSLQVHASLGIGLVATLLGLLAFGLGALLRSSAGTITIVLGLVFVPFVVGIIGSGYAWGRTLVQYSLVSTVSSQFSDRFFDHPPGAWTLAALLGGVAAAVVAAGAAAVVRRDV